MQQITTDPVAMFVFIAVVYPICGALMFYRPLQCRPGRIALWWVGSMGAQFLKAAATLAEDLGACPPGTKVLVATLVSFAAPLLLLYCFEERLAVKSICFCLAVVVDTAITVPGILLANYLAAHAGTEGLAGYLGQAGLQFLSLYITIRLLRIAKVRVARWQGNRAEHVAICGGFAYLVMVGLAALTSYRTVADGLQGLAVLVITVLMLYALLFMVVFEAHSENSALRGAVTELDNCRTMQYNALRMQQKTLDTLHMYQHDIKNHYLALQGFLARGEVAQAEGYLRELTENTPTLAAHYAANPIADVALADAALRCEEQNIAFTVGGTLPATLPMTATDLGCLLYNLLSNAIEGACRAPTPRSVAIRFAVQAGQLCITVNNTVPPGTVLHGGSTKADAQNHGFGTRIIRDIATRYDGVYVLRMNGPLAESDTMLSLENPENDTKINDIM